MNWKNKMDAQWRESYNWSGAIEYASILRNSPTYTPQPCSRYGENENGWVDENRLVYLSVQADPVDKMEIEWEEGKKEYLMHADLWRHTLDFFISEYFDAVKDLYMAQGGEMVKVDFAEGILNSFQNCLNNNNRKMEKDVLAVPEIRKDGPNNSECYYYPRFLLPLYLEYFHRTLLASANKTTSRLSPSFDGKPVEKDKQAKLISVFLDDQPYNRLPFQLEDYYMHEKYSGIGLSIEIASVYYEMYECHKERKYWDKALDTFAQKALPTIVSSDRFFYRNTVSRHFFQNLMINRISVPYFWNGMGKNDRGEKEKWDEMVENAMRPLTTLLPYCGTIRNKKQEQDDKPKTKAWIDRGERYDKVSQTLNELLPSHEMHRQMHSMADNILRFYDEADLRKECTGRDRLLTEAEIYEKLQEMEWNLRVENAEARVKRLADVLNMVKSPVDIFADRKNPSSWVKLFCNPEYEKNKIKLNRGLAIFCNPEHKNVDYYIGRIFNPLDQVRDDRNQKRPNRDALFQRVREKVLDAIEFVGYADMKDECDQLKKIPVLDRIPEDCYSAYKQLAEKEGGMILLCRMKCDGSTGAWPDGEVTQLPDIEDLVNQLKKEFKRMNGKEWDRADDDIHIWEYKSHEVISVRVPKQM